MRGIGAIVLVMLLAACSDNSEPPAPPAPVLEGGVRQEAPPLVEPEDLPLPMEEPVEEQ
ncbi:hypothetical protein [Alcanivorax sp. S71-1-4]|uniref:hypothetical protein n=1 Tax=Alcanivorax sp. S71-1-4 TaxID=1177159 RepID=UPI00135AC85E|nr:hypothetical protein [Alcanivorax sp. S71-1-4]